MKKSNILIQAWVVFKRGNRYFLPYTHWIYLKEIISYYECVYLLAPTNATQSSTIAGMVCIDDLKNVQVYELPYSVQYISALKYFPNYVKAYSRLRSINTFYTRYPSPFGWLQ